MNSHTNIIFLIQHWRKNSFFKFTRSQRSKPTRDGEALPLVGQQRARALTAGEQQAAQQRERGGGGGQQASRARAPGPRPAGVASLRRLQRRHLAPSGPRLLPRRRVFEPQHVRYQRRVAYHKHLAQFSEINRLLL